MSEATPRAEDWTGRANELYWSSDLTVDEIVEELGVSRSGLYAALEPAPAGLVCTDCHERMSYANRTARDRGVASCPACGRESGEEETTAWVTSAAEGDDRMGRSMDERGGIQGRLGRWRGDLAAVTPQRVAMVGGAAALGMVVGAVAARAVRGR